MNNRKFLKLFLALIDYALLLFSMYIVLKIRLPYATDYIYLHYKIFFPLFSSWILIFYLFELYTIGLPQQLTRLYFALIICVLLSSLLFYLFSLSFIITPKTNLALIAVLFTFLHYLIRQLFEYIYVRFFRGHTIMVAVSDGVSLELVEKLQSNHYMKYNIIAVITTQEFYSQVCKIITPEKIFTEIDTLRTEIQKHPEIKSIIVTNYWFIHLSSILYKAFHHSINIVNVTNFFEQLFLYIPIRGTNQYWIMNNFNSVSHSAYSLLKRVLDIVGTLMLIPLFTLPMIMTAIAIKLFGKKGPILDSQEQIGQHLKLFHRYKFRITYTDNKDKKNNTVINSKDLDLDTHITNILVANNKNITRLGKFLQATRLDELPQLFNILKGDMSFIGPQTEPIEITQILTKKIPHYQLRYIAKPGLLGWAQVNTHFKNSLDDFERKLCYDLFYIKNMNIVVDTNIAIKTLRTILTTRGK